MKLTDHFTLDELTRSSTAQRLDIDNDPPPDVFQHLLELANGMERVRALLGYPIRINSGYRSPALNQAVGGAKQSAHMQGWAADFVCPGFGPPLQIVRHLASNGLRFDKCIQEGTWVHISFDPRARRQLLTAHFGPHGTTYTEGV